MQENKIKQIVKNQYAKIASQSGCGGCCCKSKVIENKISKSIGYSDEELDSFSQANMGLGCGNPTAMAKIEKGNTVLDLGSGGGLDCFLAARKTGKLGKVIGIDMTEEMIEIARNNAKKYGYKNVEFKLGEIENLPIEDNSIDIIISNCVINLAPDKSKVFKEAYRVLRKGGRIYLSDIVLLENLTEEQRNDEYLISGCVGGALLKNDYLEIVKKAGFEVRVLSEDKEISKIQYQGIPLESLKIEAVK